MSLTKKLTSAFLEIYPKNSNSNLENLNQIRQNAIEKFKEEGFPTQKNEDWKYTNLKPLLKHNFSVFPSTAKSITLEDVKPYLLNNTESYNLVFVNGVFNSTLSNTTNKEYHICSFSKALENKEYKTFITHYFNTIANKNCNLTNLNTALTKEGIFIYIPKNTIVSKTIQVIHFYNGEEKEVLLQPRNLIIAEKNAQVTLVERHQNLSKNIAFTNAVTEIFAEERAIVDYYKIQNDTKTSYLIDSTFVAQKKDSLARVKTFSFGGKLTRNHLSFYHKGEQINSILEGITIIDGNQHVDNNTLVKHAQPNCQSNELYRGIYADNATGVFNGKVYVKKEAQQTNAFQQNNSILIGERASINAKPQLEIFADDVKCSHGCTIGQLDQEALFYMQTRGIAKEKAKALLLYAFNNDIVSDIKIPELKKVVTNLIATKLGINLKLIF